MLVLFACDKKPPEVLEGNIKIKAQVKHHEIPVSDAIVYIKHNSGDFPGEDLSLYNIGKEVDSLGITHFQKLFPGNYYLYAVGFDGVDSVFGAKPVVLTNEMKNTEFFSIVFVTE